MGKRIAALYDIHGNGPALQAVLEAIRTQPADAIVVGGDVTWGPEPVEVIERLMRLKEEMEVHFIRGNADREVAAGREEGLDPLVADVNQWCHDQLSLDHLQFLRSFQEQLVLEVEGMGEVLFVHGSPRSDEEAIRSGTSEEVIRPMLKGFKQRTLICGHTHIPFYRQVDGVRIINPGSVGLPRNGSGSPFYGDPLRRKWSRETDRAI